jgi:RimJ/RimL family protein N-acetyltransferase
VSTNGGGRHSCPGLAVGTTVEQDRDVEDGLMERLQSERLILREWLPSDVDFVFDMYSRWEVQRFIGRVPRVMERREEAEAAIARWRSVGLPTPLGLWAVTDRDSGRLFGTVLLKDIPASGERTPLPPSGEVEIGWHFHPAAWGHGYATEAARVVLRRAFDAGLDQVVAVTNAENIASQRVCERIGMKHEGQTSRYYNTVCELFTVTREPSSPSA